MKRTVALLLFCIGMLLALSPLGGGADTGKITVTASFFPIYNLARSVGGTHIDIVNLVPAGGEPHDYEPTPQNIKRIQESQVFIYLGADMDDAWVNKVLQSIDTSRTVIVRASDGVPLRDAPPGELGFDPHLWLDPILAQKLVTNIAQGLTAADPANAADYQANAAIALQQLSALDGMIQAGLANCTYHDLIISHTFFAYFSARYGLIPHALSGLEPSEPSPQLLVQLTQLGQQLGLKYVFAEPLSNQQAIQTLATELGARVLALDPLEGLTSNAQAQGADYLSVMLQNMQSLRLGLGCE